jgi:hypothetical protein
VIDSDVPLDHDLFHLPQAERIPKVPPHAYNEDLGFKVSSFEQRRALPSHTRRSVSDTRTADATLPGDVQCPLSFEEGCKFV